ncbi:MAG: Calx-beta domain-containing protein [Cyanobacteriota bacterium]|nr:Calx-beta domain-containing protein [Cyanobacteriota bacterium]
MPFDPEKNKIIKLGTLTEEPTTRVDEVGFTKGKDRDERDLFQFTLDKKSDFNLSLDQLQQNADITLLGSDRATIVDTSRNSSQEPENINTFLDAGTYFLEVVPKGSDRTNYLLSLNANTVDRSGDKLEQAENLGILRKKGFSVKDSIGFSIGGSRDSKDYYQFSLKQESDVTISLDELKQNANIELLDKTGSLLFSSTESGADIDKINTILEPDTYYVLVEPFSGDRTDYRLNLVANPNINDPDSRLPGNNLKKLSESRPINKRGQIGFTEGMRDQSDFYKFELVEEGNVTITLDGLKQNADIELYDRYSSLPIDTATEKGTAIDTIERILQKDTYYVKVKPKAAGTDYKLSLNVNPDIIDEDGILPGKDLGNLSELESITKRDRIGFKKGSFADSNDYYRFTLGERSDVNITLDDLDENANIFLLDFQGEKIGKGGTKSGRKSENIGEILNAGTYYVRVERSGVDSTKYRLKLTADPASGDYATLGLAKELGDLNLQDGLTERDRIGFKRGRVNDPNDYYSFRLTEESDVSINLDDLSANAQLELLDDKGQPIDDSTRGGKRSEAIGQVLEPGQYYARVFRSGNETTPYRLRLDAEPYIEDYPSLAEARDFGDLTPASKKEPTKIVERNRIGFKRGNLADTEDFYSFTLAAETDVTIKLDDMNANGNLTLLDSSGNVKVEKKRGGKRPETIAEILSPGTYGIKVSRSGNDSTQYRLGVTATTPFIDPEVIELGNIAGTEKAAVERNDIGLKNGSVVNKNDFYKFSIDEPSNFSLTLDDITANANVLLFKAIDPNLGRIESNQEKKREVKGTGSNPISFKQKLDAGTYYAQIFRSGNASTNYRLRLNADPIEPFISFEKANLTIAEGNLGADGNPAVSNLNFKVNLSEPSPKLVSVNYAVTGKNATVVEDFAATTGILSFAPGEVSKEIAVPILGDNVIEGNEKFLVGLSAPANGKFDKKSDSVAVGTIRNDDLPKVSIENLTVVEGDKGTEKATLTVKLDRAINKNVKVGYSTEDGTAIAPTDYKKLRQSITIPKNKTEAKFRIPIQGDTQIEADENFFVNLVNPQNADIGSGRATVTIQDNDEPFVRIDDAKVSLPEGNLDVAGNPTVTNFPFDVTLSSASTKAVTVNYTVEGARATVGEDFTATAGTLTFVPGETAKQVLVPVLGDDRFEGTENFTVKLSEAVGAKLRKADEAEGVIENDDLPKIAIADVEVAETGRALFTVTLEPASNKEVTVRYATGDGTAIAPNDYDRSGGLVKFSPGQTSRKFGVTIKEDEVAEGNETFVVNLKNAQNAEIADGQAVGTIIDNDVAVEQRRRSRLEPDVLTDGGKSDGANSDYAVIANFDPAKDTIQLHDGASDYLVASNDMDGAMYLGNNEAELIDIVKDSGFSFV